MLVKLGEIWVNPRHVPKVQDCKGESGRWVWVSVLGQSLPPGFEISGKGVTADLVARYLNECELNDYSPQLGWDMFLKRQKATPDLALSEAQKIFGRLEAGTTLKLGEREYVIWGKIESQGAFVAEFWKAREVGSGDDINVTFESLLNTQRAGFEISIIMEAMKPVEEEGG